MLTLSNNLKSSFVMEQLCKSPRGFPCQALSVSNHHSFLTNNTAQRLQNILWVTLKEVNISLLTLAYPSPLSIVLIMALISWTVWGTVLPTYFIWYWYSRETKLHWTEWKCGPMAQGHMKSFWHELTQLTSFCFSRSARRSQDPWCVLFLLMVKIQELIDGGHF